MVVSGAGLPSVCARHGEIAVDRPKTVFQSSPPPWSYVLLFAGVLPFLLITNALRKRLIAVGWPVCARCRRQRRTLQLGALGLFLLSLLSMVLSLAASPDSSLTLLGPAVGLILFVASLFVFGASAVAVISRAGVTRDGCALRLRNVSPVFAAALPAIPLPTGPGTTPRW